MVLSITYRPSLEIVHVSRDQDNKAYLKSQCAGVDWSIRIRAILINYFKRFIPITSGHGSIYFLT